MTQTNKIAVGFGLGVVSLWDAITTIYGTHTIAGDSTIQYVISVGLGVGLAIVMLRTLPILTNPKEDFFSVSVKGVWFLALLYDLYTAYIGNFNLLLSSVNDTPKIIIAIGLTIFTCYAPIYLSKIVFDTEEE